jgi:hypothetical protein
MYELDGVEADPWLCHEPDAERPPWMLGLSVAS